MPEIPKQTQELSLTRLQTIKIADLFGGLVPPQADLVSKSKYTLLGNLPLNIFKLQNNSSQEAEFVLSSRPLTGLEVNYLLHFAAPSKRYLLDTDDIRVDWHDLFENPQHKGRLEAHRRLDGWTQFEERRVQILEAIEKDADKLAGPKDVVIPVIHLHKNSQGVFSWKFDISADIGTQILSEFPQLENDQNYLLTALGPVLVAAYSPRVTSTWGTRLGYTENGMKRTQDMGSTQALPLSIGLAPTLLEGEFMTGLINYLNSGTLPASYTNMDYQIDAIDVLNFALSQPPLQTADNEQLYNQISNSNIILDSYSLQKDATSYKETKQNYSLINTDQASSTLINKNNFFKPKSGKNESGPSIKITKSMMLVATVMLALGNVENASSNNNI